MTLSRKRLFATTMIGGIAAAAAAFAQTPPPPAPTPQTPAEQEAQQAQQAQPAPEAPAASGELVVTGSHIRRTEFTSPSPIAVITSEASTLAGEVDVSDILQHTPAADNNTQINNFFTGFVVTGGPGVNTLSLRGLGAQRTLFLINGRRLGPAGVGGTVGPVDLNTIPNSLIDRIEILKDGASSIYGSDAIAGVVNIITKKNIDGASIEAYGNPTQHGGGSIWEINGTIGKTWDRGYVNAGVDFYRQDALTVGQRPYLSCANDLAFDSTTGQRADLIDPATGKPKCLNIFTNSIEDLARGRIYRPDAAAVLHGGVTHRDLNGFQAVNLTIPGDPAATRLSHALTVEDDPLFAKSDAISPVTRYTITASAGYDLTPHAHLYGEFLFNRRDSSQFFVDQFFTIVDPGNPFNPGGQFLFPLPIVSQPVPFKQSVNYTRFVGGVTGDVPDIGPFRNWTYDLYGQYSHSSGSYSTTVALQDRVNATAGAGAGTNGCDVNAVAIGGGGETMAQLEPGVACVPIDYFSAVVNGTFTPAERAFLYRNETGHTTYDHEYVEGILSGDLLRLPAGPLGASFGFQLRHESIDDRPGPDFQNANAFNVSAAGHTHGYDNIEEVFGELNAPLLKGLPMIQNLGINVSGRYSNYRSSGSTATYKIGATWNLTDWLAFRATQATGFRAPALYELFLADQTSFLGQSAIDPCINYGAGGVSQNVQKNCASLGIPPDFVGGDTSAQIFTGGGIGNLKPETSTSKTVGVVFTPKWYGIDLSVAADYYTFDIRNQIQQFGAGNIVFACYDSTNSPNSPFCSLFTRNPANAPDNALGIAVVHDNFVNVARQLDQGLDVSLRFRHPLVWDTVFTLESELDWTFYTNTILLGGQTNNFLGQVGQPTFVGNANFKFDKGPWTFNWFLQMVGGASDNKFVPDTDPNFHNTGESVFLIHRARFYSISTIALQRKFHDFTITAGVKNLFDKNPPIYSSEGFQSRIGNFPLATQYDLIGRSFFIDLKKTF